MVAMYLNDLINMNPEGRYHLTNDDQLMVPRTRCKTFGDRAFSKSEPVLWNSLPARISQITNIERFKVIRFYCKIDTTILFNL